MYREITIIFPQSTLLHRTRLTKLATIAYNLDMDISTWAWERKKGDFNDELKLSFKERKVLLRGGGYNTRWIRFYYPGWVLSVFLRLLVRRPKAPVYCLGFETAFPAWLAGKIVGVKYIFDDADRFSMIISLPAPLKKILKKMEKRVSEDSIINIIPGHERYEFRNDRQFVVKNMPDQAALEKSKLISVDRPKKKLVIYVNGWMGETRGMPIALKLANRLVLSNSSVCFIAAGNVDGYSAEKFVSLPNVKYLGALKNHEALAWYRVADLVFTYYDPAIEINRYAESNKWGDGVLFNVPAIVNKEVLTAEFLRSANACVSVPYHDLDALEKKINELIKDKQYFDQIKSNLLVKRSSIRYFDEAIKEVIQNAYFEEAFGSVNF